MDGVNKHLWAGEQGTVLANRGHKLATEVWGYPDTHRNNMYSKSGDGKHLPVLNLHFKQRGQKISR